MEEIMKAIKIFLQICTKFRRLEWLKWWSTDLTHQRPWPQYSKTKQQSVKLS
jgi:hypothetical protein